MKKTIVIVDDHAILREGLRNLLEATGRYEVAGEAGDGRSAVRLVGQGRPDIVIMDVSMPELNGIDATRQILAENPQVKILALSMYGDRHLVDEMLSAGASAYVLKEATYAEIEEALATVLGGGTWLSPPILAGVARAYVRRIHLEERAEPSRLTTREREVLQLVAEGKTTKDIGVTLFLSPKTIDTHRQQIMRKLDLHSIADLTRYALRMGLTRIEG